VCIVLNCIVRCNTTSVAATVAPPRERTLPHSARQENIANKAVETGDAVTVQLSALDEQVRRTERLEIYKVQQILELIVKNGR